MMSQGGYMIILRFSRIKFKNKNRLQAFTSVRHIRWVRDIPLTYKKSGYRYYFIYGKVTDADICFSILSLDRHEAGSSLE